MTAAAVALGLMVERLVCVKQRYVSVIFLAPLSFTSSLT